MTDWDEAIEDLRYPQTWCKGAQLLAELGDRRALIPLMRAFERPAEVSKVCLLDAMDALGAVVGAHELCNSASAQERRLGVHLMELFPAEDHMLLLEHAVDDRVPAVRRQALRALACQVQTPAWEAAMVRLLGAEGEETRAQAIQSLSRRRTDTARQALRLALEREPSATLRARLHEVLGVTGDH